jgi:hypothetical protein
MTYASILLYVILGMAYIQCLTFDDQFLLTISTLLFILNENELLFKLIIFKINNKNIIQNNLYHLTKFFLIRRFVK